MNGKQANGKQRWYCNNCGQSYQWKNPKVRSSNRFIWFKKWIIEGYTYRQISALSGYSISTVRRIIYTYLDQQPPVVMNLDKYKYIILDGTYLINHRGIFIVMDGVSKKVIASRFNIAENAQSLLSFFCQLKEQGLTPISATIDGNPAIKRALLNVWPFVIVQRCLVHIQRQGLSWCRMVPKRTDAKYLRKLFLQVTLIYNKYDSDLFIQNVQEWEQHFGHPIRTKPGVGRVFSDIKRARSMLLKALPDMFNYLKDDNILKTTNGVEGYFGRMKQKYRQHSGLSESRKITFFQWYIYFCKR